METTSKPRPAHLGRKISLLRELRGMKQDTLALELGVSQQTVSRIEQSEAVDNELLEKIAKVFNMSADNIKNIDEEKIITNIQNNYEGSNNGAIGVAAQNYGCTFNPLDKLMEVIDDNKKLYERLLKVQEEQLELLKKMVG
jgi:transcriptional regulator with XRE-family HTH domain